MMMMPWGKGKGKVGLHVIPNDSLVSLRPSCMHSTPIKHVFCILLLCVLQGSKDL